MINLKIKLNTEFLEFRKEIRQKNEEINLDYEYINLKENNEISTILRKERDFIKVEDLENDNRFKSTSTKTDIEVKEDENQLKLRSLTQEEIDDIEWENLKSYFSIIAS